jgi:lipase chaperone LimK
VIKARSIWLSVAVLVIAALGANYLLQSDANKSSENSNTNTQGDSVTDSQASASNSKPTLKKADFSLERSSLRGTEADGGISLDANAEVVLDLGMRRLFDYYLSLIGERDLVQIRILLKDQLLTKYNQTNTEKVLQYFDRYTDYLSALAALNIGSLSKPEERLQQVASLRKKMLGEAMALAFFAEEEALATLTLKRMAIANNKKLSAEARIEADTAALITEQNRQLDALKLTDAQRAVEREALWGKEAAGRLAQLDQERTQWDTRIEQYVQARSRIDANRALSVNARAQAIAALRAQQFNASEQRRIASLEAIGQLKPGG